MDYLKMLSIAETKNMNEEFISTIKDCIESSSTGGEITDCIGGYLSKHKKKKTKEYYLLENEINQYLQGCALNGTTFR
jgi:hypothetical protein